MFDRRVKQLAKQADKLPKVAIKRTGKIVNEFRKNVISELSQEQVVDGTWRAYRLNDLKRMADNVSKDFDDRYFQQLKLDQGAGWDLGVERIDGPLKAAQVDLTRLIPEISRSQLSIMQGYSADLIKDVSLSALKNINSQLTLGIMGGSSPYEVMTAIGRNLKDPSIFKSIALRAETITRTEMGRMQNTATQARQAQAQKALPKLKQRWHWSGVSRADHAAIDGQVRGVDEWFDLPGGTQILYPLGPVRPVDQAAKQTINCSCWVEAFMEDWKDLPGGV